MTRKVTLPVILTSIFVHDIYEYMDLDTVIDMNVDTEIDTEFNINTNDEKIKHDLGIDLTDKVIGCDTIIINSLD